jgi:RNA polymerase sigma-70 factor (ECF subfamily)
MQDSFVRILERWDHVSAIEDPESYVFRTAMNVFRNRYRRAALAVRRTMLLSPKATDDLAAVEARHEVVRLLRPLAPRERAAIVLTQILDLPAEEAGRMLGIKASSVRALVSRARSHIKDEVVDPP